MKILYGITKANFGGAQRYVFELADEAVRRGHEVKVVSGSEGKLAEKLRRANIGVIVLNDLKRDISILGDLKSFFKLVGILAKEKPDVFHINSSKMGGLGALAGRLAGVKKIIFTAHGWAFNEPRPEIQKILIRVLTWITLILAHKTICVSERTFKDVLNLPFVKNKLHVIYNGVSSFPLKERENNTFTVGTIAELHRIKGLDILLLAWEKFVKKHTGKLVIIGSGEEEVNLKNLSKKLSVDSSVEFKGFVEDARSLLKNFDIFVLPSRSEAMPYALLEAGVSGIPVIASSVGGIPEVIESSMNGALIPPGDSEALFSSLVLFYDNPRMRDRLGQTLKETVEEKFSQEKMFENTFKLYS